METSQAEAQRISAATAISTRMDDAQACGARCVVAGEQRREAQLVEGGNQQQQGDEPELDQQPLLPGDVEAQRAARQQQHQQRSGRQQAADDENSPRPEQLDRRHRIGGLHAPRHGDECKERAEPPMHGRQVDEEKRRHQKAPFAGGRMAFEQERADQNKRQREADRSPSQSHRDDHGRREQAHGRRLTDRRLHTHPAQLGTERQRPIPIGDGELKDDVAHGLEHEQQEEADDDLPAQHGCHRVARLRKARPKQHRARNRDGAGVGECAQQYGRLLGNDHWAPAPPPATVKAKWPFITCPSCETAVHVTS